LHRWLLRSRPPQPLGEDLAEVAYVEVSARRLAARKAVEELELFKTLPSVDEHTVDDAKRTFAHWEESAGIGLKNSVRTYPSTNHHAPPPSQGSTDPDRRH
jgi:monovalent cation:H+ antiporter, CPA1 family